MSSLSLNHAKGQPISSVIRDKFEPAVKALTALISDQLSDDSDFATYESVMMEVCNEVEKRILQQKLEQISQAHASDYLLIDGLRYKRHSAGSVAYHSLCGSMEIERYTYRQTGIRNGPTVVPLDLCAGLTERATPALAFRAALGDAQCPGRQWEEQLRACHRKPPSRSTLERIAKKIGATAKEAGPRILSLIRADEKTHDNAVALSIGLDRTTIPMEEKLRFATSSVRRRKKPYVRSAPAPVAVNYRMGYVGTVSVIDDDAQCIQTFRYGCSADADPADILKMMTDDVKSIQNKRKKLRLSPLPMGIVQDGAPEMWNLVETSVSQALPGKQFEKAIDRFHLSERLGESLKALKDPGLNREIRLRQWSHALANDDGAIDDIERFITKERNRLKAAKRLSHEAAEIIRSHLTYISNNKHLMRYASIRKRGLPTGSGATEGACKSLIMIRTKGCGQRWHTSGVDSVLTLRGLYQSDRLRAFWKIMTDIRKGNIQIAA
jgi:hypothetical protein